MCLSSCLLGCRAFQGQGLGIIVWAFAKIGYDPSKIRDLLQAFAQEVFDPCQWHVVHREPSHWLQLRHHCSQACPGWTLFVLRVP